MQSQLGTKREKYFSFGKAFCAVNCCSFNVKKKKCRPVSCIHANIFSSSWAHSLHLSLPAFITARRKLVGYFMLRLTDNAIYWSLAEMDVPDFRHERLTNEPESMEFQRANDRDVCIYLYLYLPPTPSKKPQINDHFRRLQWGGSGGHSVLTAHYNGPSGLREGGLIPGTLPLVSPPLHPLLANKAAVIKKPGASIQMRRLPLCCKACSHT